MKARARVSVQTRRTFKRPKSPSQRSSTRPKPRGAPPWRQPSEIDRKLQPKLRMVANVNTSVGVLRAERSSCVAVRSDKLIKQYGTAPDSVSIPKRRRQLPKTVRRGKQKAVPSDVYVNVFIQTSDVKDSKARPKRFHGETARRGNLVSATVPLSKLASIATLPSVTNVELGEPLKEPSPVISDKHATTPGRGRRRFGSARRHRSGKDVLIGIVDVQGFDFSHPDFRDAKTGGTRFVSIWDQGAKYVKGNPSIDPFGYGREITIELMDAAIKAAPGVGLPAYELEPQSQMVEGSHGTHVASIAAGNRGVCRRAKIAAVLVSLPAEDLERRKSFYDSTRVVHAVEYLLKLASKLGEGGRPKPISINVSLGTNGHAHDASSSLNRWIDSALAVPGRCVTVAAGNAGQEAPEFEGDRGFVMGRIHTGGKIPSRELYSDIEWLVVGNGVVDVSENELEIWYGAQDRFLVSLQTPRGDWIGPVAPREYLENVQLVDGSMLSIYNELYHPANGCNCIAIYLSPFFAKEGVVGIPAGTWRVRLEGKEVRDGSYHGWIERDDPRRLGRIGSKELWSFPSFFSEGSNVDRSSVSSLACAMHVVSVANFDSARDRINITSSQGPTRDERCKPDVAAPGTNIVAARGFSPGDPWVAMTGTSMASPHVAGLIGLMFAIEPTLTAAQVNGIIQRTSRPLPGCGFAWAHDAGFGRLMEAACLSEAASVNRRQDVFPRGRIPAKGPRALGSREEGKVR